MILPQVMLQIIQARGNLVIDLNKQFIIPQVMMQLAMSAANYNTNITFKNFEGKILPQVMVSVSLAGNGHVTFEQ